MTDFFLESDLKEIVENLGPVVKKFSNRTILLTGGRGFLGRYFIEVFNYLSKNILEKPLKVIVLDNLIASGKEGSNFPKYDNIIFKNHNVIEPFLVEEKIDYVIHAAGIASPYYYKKFPIETLEVSILGTKNMLQLAKKNNARFCFFSSSEIYGDPDPKYIPIKESYRGNVSCQGPRACYDESKRVGETLSDIYHNYYNLKTNTIRPFNIYGPGMQETDYRVLPNFASQIKKKKPLNIYGKGSQTRTFCYITDAIVGFLLVILNGKKGEAYNIGNTGPEISIVDLAEIIIKVSNKNISYKITEYPSSYPEDEPNRRLPDISKAANDLSFYPKISLEEGLKRFLDWSEKYYSSAE